MCIACKHLNDLLRGAVLGGLGVGCVHDNNGRTDRAQESLEEGVVDIFAALLTQFLER